jgi:hypothetical protein
MERLGSADILPFEDLRLDRRGRPRLGQGGLDAPVAIGWRALGPLGLLESS